MRRAAPAPLSSCRRSPGSESRPRLSRHPSAPVAAGPRISPGASPAPPPQRGAPCPGPAGPGSGARTPVLGARVSLPGASPWPDSPPPWSASALSRLLPAFLSLRLGRQFPSLRSPSGRLPGMRSDFCPHLYPDFPSPGSPHSFPSILGPLGISLAPSRPPTPTPRHVSLGFAFCPQMLSFPNSPLLSPFSSPTVANTSFPLRLNLQTLLLS